MDSTSSSVAIVAGDPSQAAGSLSFGGIVLGLDSGTVTTQTPRVTGVLNAADLSTKLCPGILAAIFGTNFGATASAVTVSVGGKQGQVLFVSATQINAQLPVEAAAGATAITVTVGGTASAPLNITLEAYAPAFFSVGGVGSIFTPNSALPTTVSPAKPGDVLVAYLIGLGPTNPVTPTGPARAANPTATPPTLTVGGTAAAIVYAGVAPNQVGLYQINFMVPAGLQGTLPVVVSIGGKSTSPVTLALFGISTVVSNASFGSVGTAAAGSIASVFANGLGATDQSTGFPSTTFQGVSVTFNGTPAPLFHLTATQGQIDLLIPFELPESGTVDVQVRTPSGPSPTYTLRMAAATPGLYFLADPSTRNRFNVIAQFANTAWLAMPGAMGAALRIPGNCTASNVDPAALCAQPAAPGDYLVLYATGLGKATPNGDPNGATVRTGAVAPADGSVLYRTVGTPSVTVGGVPVAVLFSGLSPGFAGLYQINFQVPGGVTGDDVPAAVTMAGNTDTRTISIQPR
jgi:uncharacterized protein (TIGR03437 family)